MSEIIIPRVYKPLLTLNHSAEMAEKYDSPSYRVEIVKRVLNGERVELSELGVKEFLPYSGRLSGKTTSNEIAMGLDIRRYKGDMWYCRSELGDIRNSIFQSMQNTLHSLGATVSSEKGCTFRSKTAPFELIHNASGNKIQFFGINKDINRSKGFTPPSGILQRVTIEEMNEVDEPKYITAVETTAARFLQAQSKIVKCCNPPETKQHWTVSYIEERKRAGATWIYATWENLARLNLLSMATIAEIVKMRETNPLFYRYWYLGEIVNMSGLVFPQFEREKHVVNTIDRNRVAGLTSRYIVAGDAANKNDPTCFLLMCELSRPTPGTWLIVDAMYYDPRINGQLDDVELARCVCDWYDAAMAKYPGLEYRQGRGTVDNANWNLMRMLERSRSLGHFRWVPATNKSIMRDVNRLRVLLREGLLIFHDAPDNQVREVIREFEAFVYDEKTGQIKANQDDHGIDATKYGTFLAFTDTKEFF